MEALSSKDPSLDKFSQKRMCGRSSMLGKVTQTNENNVKKISWSP